MSREVDTKQRLIMAAFELMHERGYNAVGVKEICQRAGVNKGSFYYFFPSKRDLGIAVVELYCEKIQQDFFERAFESDGSAFDKIHQFFQLVYAHAHRVQHEYGSPLKGCLVGNIALELSASDESMRIKFQEVFQSWTTLIEDVLVEALQTGELVGIEPRPLAQAILAFYEGASMMAKTYNDASLLEQLAETFFESITAGISCNN